jgi:hypothetical protein
MSSASSSRHLQAAFEAELFPEATLMLRSEATVFPCTQPFAVSTSVDAAAPVIIPSNNSKNIAAAIISASQSISADLAMRYFFVDGHNSLPEARI